MSFTLLNCIGLRELALAVNDFIIINFNSVFSEQNKEIRFYEIY